MAQNASLRRRWFGVLLLAASIAMLVAGETVLSGRLSGGIFLGYWLVCLVLTSLAVVVAFRDVRAVQEGVLREQQSLIEDTLKDIQAEAKAKKRRKQ